MTSDENVESGRFVREESVSDETACAGNENESLARKPWSVNERGSDNARENAVVFRFCVSEKNANDKNGCGWNANGNDSANWKDSENARDKNGNAKDYCRSDDCAKTVRDWKESARDWNENGCRGSNARDWNDNA